MNCVMHSDTEYRKFCVYCKFKTNTPALIRACKNNDLNTALVFYKAGFRIITQLDPEESHKVSSSRTFVPYHLYEYNRNMI